MVWLFNFCGDQVFMDFIRYLSMIIYEFLCTVHDVKGIILAAPGF